MADATGATMRAIVLSDDLLPQVRDDVAVPTATPGTALVRIHAAAFNRRDYWMTKGLYPFIQTPCVLGADGCGVVEDVGSADDAAWVGKRVVINPSRGWGSDETAQDFRTFKILGMPDPGTLADYVVVGADRLHCVPDHLSDAEAAALPLAHVTAYRATVVKGGVGPGDVVLVTGIGGGVALAALQFAIAAGAEAVWVTSSKEAKIERAVQLGATGGVLYSDPAWRAALLERAGTKFDVVIDGTGGGMLKDMLRVLRPGGVLSTYGATLGSADKLELAKVFLNQLEIRGTTMGSDADFEAMLETVRRHAIVPVVDSITPFEDGLVCFDTMEKSSQFGKLVVSLFTRSRL